MQQLWIPACNFLFPRQSNWMWSSPYPCNWGDWWIQWYCSELSDSLPVSAVRVYSISTKLSMWRRWEVESGPFPSGVCGVTRFVVEISSNYSRTLKQYCKTLTFLQMFSIYILILFRLANKCRLMLSLLPFCSQLHCLWGSFLFLWSDRWAIQQYHSCLRVSLPVSTRVSTRGKEDIAVWGRWKVEPWPSESLYRYKY